MFMKLNGFDPARTPLIDKLLDADLLNN